MQWKKFFQDQAGRVVIVQAPNPPLYLATSLYLLRFIGHPQLAQLSHWGVALVMLYWSYLEIRAGSSPFRRVLGVVVGSYFLLALVR